MRVLTAIFIALAMTACATKGLSVVALTDATPLERHVFRYYQDLAAINASVGNEPIVYTLDRPDDVQRYQQLIAARFEGDLRREYPTGIRPATQMLLLIGARGDRDLVQLIRLGSTSPDGAFERLEGLTYIFDRGSKNLLDVQGTEY
jgi:hypothetical protein